MEAINIRLYYGGHFVSKKNKTTYERKANGDKSKFGVALRLHVEEVYFFEFTYWIKTNLGYDDVGEIWYGKKGLTLHSGRVMISCDADIPNFLDAPEKDAFYHLYVVHPDKKVEVVKTDAYGPGMTFYTDTENTGGESELESGVSAKKTNQENIESSNNSEGVHKKVYRRVHKRVYRGSTVQHPDTYAHREP